MRDVLSRAGDDKREAARILEISLASLYRKLDVDSDKREPAPMLETGLASLYRNLDIDGEPPPC